MKHFLINNFCWPKVNGYDTLEDEEGMNENDYQCEMCMKSLLPWKIKDAHTRNVFSINCL